MRVIGLNGKTYQLKYKQAKVRKRSSYHKRAHALLQKLFPLQTILQELPLPGSEGLWADFFLPVYKLMVEVHGEQHYTIVPFFHGSTDREAQLNFLYAQARDKQKKAWCEINDIRLVCLPFDEDDSAWISRLQ